MEKQKVLDAVKILNGIVYEDDEKDKKMPLIATKVKTVAVKDEDLIVAFMTACESISEENEQYLPDDVADVYNDLDKEGYTSRGKVEAATTVEKPAKPKIDRQAPVRPKDAFGNVIGTMCGDISAMLVAGSKKEAIIQVLRQKFGRSEEKATNYLKGCLKSWKSRGLDITEKDGVVTMSLPKK